MLLAIDTSTRQASIALYAPARGLLAEQSWFSANRHTEELMPAISALLKLAGATPRDLDAAGVAIGPGSFTGLRVGLAAAKGLAMAQGLKLVGVPTLDVTARPHEAQPVPVIAVAQAGRGRLYWAPYAHGPSGWGPQEPYALSTVAEVANAVVHPMLFAGELTDADRESLVRLAGAKRAGFLSPALGLRRAGVLAELALRRLENGEADDPAMLSPIYLQQPDGSKATPLTGDRSKGLA
jgi:tRNA threonylcarbamoyladenosine biosynthesis protein TsaB